MGLSEEISAVAFSLATIPSNSISVWLAFGTCVAHFDASGDRLVMKLADASQTHTLLTSLDGESDVLNDVLDPFAQETGFTSSNAYFHDVDRRFAHSSWLYIRFRYRWSPRPWHRGEKRNAYETFQCDTTCIVTAQPKSYVFRRSLAPYHSFRTGPANVSPFTRRLAQLRHLSSPSGFWGL